MDDEMWARLRWHPGIGDPTVYGWLAVFGYVLAAVLAWRAARASPVAPDQTRWFWSAIAMFLLLLGINKQLDLQTLLTGIGRLLARQEGWYRERRHVQIIFMVVLATSALLTIITLIARFRRAGFWVLLAVGGAVMLVFFILIRAISFHHVDALLRLRWAGAKLHEAIELAGIALIAFAAFGYTRRRRAGLSTAPR